MNGSCLNGCDVGVYGEKCDRGKFIPQNKVYELIEANFNLRGIFGFLFAWIFVIKTDRYITHI